jgi:ankyrin repeat protein
MSSWVRSLVGNDANLDLVLMSSVRHGKLKAAKLLIESGKIENLDKIIEGCTPLTLAASSGSLDIMKILITNGADVNKANNNDDLPIHIATEFKNYKMLNLLLENGSKVNEKNNRGHTPLFNATSISDLKMVILLLDHGADVHISDVCNWTPLCEACFRGDTIIAKLLIAKTDGDHINDMDNAGRTALMIATKYKRVDVVKLLIENGADINKINSPEGWTPLCIACYSGNLEIVKVLSEYGNVNTTTSEGNSPIILAALNGYTEIVRILLERGADVNKSDFREWTSLHSAADYLHLETVKLLIENGANVNKSNTGGKTPLFYTLSSDHYVNHDGDDFYTAKNIESSRLKNINLISNLLLDHGARVDHNIIGLLQHEVMNPDLRERLIAIRNGWTLDTHHCFSIKVKADIEMVVKLSKTTGQLQRLPKDVLFHLCKKLSK